MVPNASVILWANYRRDKVTNVTIAVPSPADGSSTVWWYDRISELAQTLAQQGFTHILFPNPILSAGGAGVGNDGYGPWDDYNIGDKGYPTRFGDDEQFRRAVAVCRANGLFVLIDDVLHQRDGGNNGTYTYGSATGKDDGLFPKHPSCFTGYDAKGRLLPGRVPRDPIPDVPDDASFGDELAPVNALPKGYVWNGLLDAGDYLFRTADLDGARLDDTKGLNLGFIKAYINHGRMAGKWFFGEYASGAPSDLQWYIAQMEGQVSATDFDFHYNRCEPMCNNATTFNMAALSNRGFMASNPMQSVPFVESMDSDVDGFATIVFDKALGYALMLGGEGRPLVYIRDYLSDPSCYGLSAPIANAVYVNRMLANGPTVPRWQNDRVFVFERTGAPGLVVTLNNDVFNPNWQTVSFQTSYAPGTHLHDFSGHNQQNCFVGEGGWVTLGIPPATNGTGYGFWSVAGIGGPIAITRRSTTQEFFGGKGRSIGPAINGAKTLTCGIEVEAGHPVQVRFVAASKDGWTETSSIEAYVNGPDGRLVALTRETLTGKPTGTSVAARSTGRHTITVVGENLPEGTGNSFVAAVTYMAPQTFTPEPAA